MIGSKHYLVIGGSKGSGLAFVRYISSRKVKVSVIARTSTKASTRKNVKFYPGDIERMDELKLVLSQIVSKRGPITHLVFFQRFRGHGDSWKGEFNVSLNATKEIIEFMSAHFDSSPDRSIVVIGSLAKSYIASEQNLAYHVMKAGLSQLVKFYASTLGRYGIRVNEVIPGTVLKDESRDYFLKNRKLQKLYREIIPLGRMGTSEDIAQVVEFFCSSTSSYITGQSLVVDGGLCNELQDSLARTVAGLNVISKKSKKNKV